MRWIIDIYHLLVRGYTDRDRWEMLRVVARNAKISPPLHMTDRQMKALFDPANARLVEDAGMPDSEERISRPVAVGSESEHGDENFKIDVSFNGRSDIGTGKGGVMRAQECAACKPRPNGMVFVDADGNCSGCGRSITANATVENEDTTGLCAVREWVDAIIEGGIRAGFNEHEGFVPPLRVGPLGFTPLWGEMSFVKDGKRYNVEAVITRIEDDPDVLAPGFYWTKDRQDCPWIIAEWTGGIWMIRGFSFTRKEFPDFIVGERVNEPK